MGIVIPPAVAGIGKTLCDCGISKSFDLSVDGLAGAWKVWKVVSKDRKYIKQVFTKENYSKYFLEEFFFERIFRDIQFVYPGENLPVEKEDRLISEFSDHISSKLGKGTIPAEKDNEFRQDLVRCVNNHNQLIHEHLLSRTEKIVVREIKNKIDALGYAGHTLFAETDLLTSNPELEYTHQQVDGILRALRMDLKFYRLMLLLCVAGIFTLASLIVICYPKYRLTGAAGCFVALFLATLIALAAIGSWLLKKILSCEMRVTEYTDVVWKINISGYKALLGQIMRDTGMSDQEDEVEDS